MLTLVKTNIKYHYIYPQVNVEVARMKFGEAQDAMKNGKKVTRQVWHDKNVFAYIVFGRIVPAQFWTGPAECIRQGGVQISAHIDMLMADGSVCIGWNPTQVDLMADDWEVVE